MERTGQQSMLKAAELQHACAEPPRACRDRLDSAVMRPRLYFSNINYVGAAGVRKDHRY